MPKKFEGQLCIYCCERPSTTEDGDHVIARGFFPKDQRTHEHNPIKVPACKACQDEFHKDEEYLIPLFATDINSVHPAALELGKGAVTRSLQKRHGVWKPIQRNAQQVSLFTKSGLYWAETAMIMPERERYDRVFDKMMRGLYYYHTKQRFPREYDFALFEFDQTGCDQHWLKMQDLECNGPFELGSGIFRYAFCLFPDDLLFTEWLMVFYQGKYFNVKTRAKKRPGHVLELKESLHPLAAGLYILIDRNEQEATLCHAAYQLPTGHVGPSPLIHKVAPAILSCFTVTDHVNLDASVLNMGASSV